MRGKVLRCAEALLHLGITPAHAGKSYHDFYINKTVQDHPRACGEKRMVTLRSTFPVRITPAHAGKSQKYEPNLN